MKQLLLAQHKMKELLIILLLKVKELGNNTYISQLNDTFLLTCKIFYSFYDPL